MLQGSGDHTDGPAAPRRARAGGTTVALLIALACAGAPAAGAADWPVYGKDLANSRDGGSGGPAPGEVASLKQTWRFDTADGDFTGTPAIAGGVLVAGTWGGTIVALDGVTGTTRWTRDIDQPINGSATIVPEPNAPGGGLVYVPVARKNAPHLLALRLSDGSTAWDRTLTTHEGSSVFGSPVAWNGSVYIGTSADQGDNSTLRGSVLALDAKTGGVKWETFMVPPGHDGGPVWSTPAIDTETGRLFVGTGNAYHEPASEMTDSIVALDARSGAVLAHFQATPDDVFSTGDNPAGPDADFGASPNLFTAPDGRKLVGAGQKSGVYWALDRTTLQPVWRTTVGPATPAGGVIGSTAFDAARIYGPNTPGAELWALDHSGTSKWTSADTGPASFSPVQTSNGVVYVSDFAGSVTAHDAATGAVLTKLPVGAPSFGGVAIVGKGVYAAVGTSMNNGGAIVAFGDTSGAAAPTGAAGGGGPTAQRRPRLRVRVLPRRVRTGRRTRFRFRVTSGTKKVAGATVRFARRRATTNGSGRATIVATLHRTGLPRARASRTGYRSGRVPIRALRPRR